MSFSVPARWCTTLLLAAAGAVAAEGPAATTTVTLLYTSDTHAHVVPEDLVRQRPRRGSIAQVATLAASVRAENPATLLLDGGDAIEGDVISYYAIAAENAPGVDPTVAAMNAAAYDAAVIGNHEFNFGLDALRRSLAQSRFPWLAANLEGAGEARLPVGDELVFDRGGVRVGVLGLTNPNVPHWDPEEHWRGLRFLDPVEVARRRVAALREEADVVVVIAHTGFERDLDSGVSEGSEDENYANRLAAVPGVDVLLTGHTHRDILPREVDGTIVAQPGRWAEHVTRIDLDFERVDGAWRRAGWHGANLQVRGLVPDERVVAAVAPARDRADALLSQPIGRLAEPLVTGGVAAEDDPAIDLIHAAQLAATGAQLSLAAPLSSARISFPAGVVTPRLAHALYVYPNTLVVVRLSGAQVRDVLEHAVAGWVGVECEATGACTALRDPGEPPYMFDTMEGVEYAVDLAAPVGERIKALRFAGRPIDLHELFTVVINSYRASGGGGYPHLAEAERVAEVKRPMAEILVDYIRERRKIDPAASGNWVFTLDFATGVAEGLRQH